MYIELNVRLAAISRLNVSIIISNAFLFLHRKRLLGSL